MDERGHEALIFISVYPDDKAYAALDFLNRNADEFKQYVRSKLRMKDIPRYRFLQDPHVGGVGEAVPVE
jgi:ribosome-binding factor A